MENQSKLKENVITALFAGVIYLGIQSFRIPLPAAVGTPFLHFGHIFVMLAVICLGPARSTVAGVLGLIIFDIINGYIHAIPNVLVSTIIKCLLVGYLYGIMKRHAQGDKKKLYAAGIASAAIYGVLNIILDFVISTIELLIAGSGLNAAIAAEITSIPATMINAVFAVIGIAILYVPVTTAYQKICQS